MAINRRRGGTELYYDIGPSLIASGSIITIGSIDAVQTPMPLELLSFTQRETDTESELLWLSSNEENFSHFELQSSSDLTNWTVKARINGKGGNQINTYNYTLAD